MEHARAMVVAGADVVDVGGESSRPKGQVYGSGFDAVTADEEIRRVIPIVRALREEGVTVSVDTVKGEVAKAAIDAGATIINDVSGGRDPSLLQACADADVTLVLMHNRGAGEVQGNNVQYDDVVTDVVKELSEMVARAEAAGVERARLWTDPGLGFAKTATQSLDLLGMTDALSDLQVPFLVGASRKSFLAHTVPGPDGTPPSPEQREGMTCATTAWSVLLGARAVRVHEVLLARQTARMMEALLAARGRRCPGSKGHA